MKTKHLLMLCGGALCCGLLSYSLTALAGQGPVGGPSPASAEKMEAVKACAAAKGVEMPEPPSEKQAGQRPSNPPPQLTDEQRAVMDACFKANGLEPPKGPPPHR